MDDTEHSNPPSDGEEDPEPAPDPPKPKRVLSEAQLRVLAEGRKKAIERKKQASVITRATQLARDTKRAAFQERVAAAKETIAELEAKPAAPASPEGKDHGAAPRPAALGSAKDEYYREKLRLLREREEAERQRVDWQRAYTSAPSSVHAADIARQSLMNRANKAVLHRAYREIFPDD